MMKFDTLCGLSKKEIDIIKYNVKKEIYRQLPELPDQVETHLFLQGRNAWTFTWCLLNEKSPIALNEIISLEVVAKLKKEFHQFKKIKHYTFLYKIQTQQDIYHPKISIALT